MDAIAAQVIAGVLSSDLVKETVFSVAKFIRERGKKPSEKVMDYIENAEKGKIPDDEKVPEDVQAEIKGSLKDILKETSEPVYSGGVALFLDQKLTEEEKRDLKGIFTSANDEPEYEYEAPEGKEEYLETVEDFMSDYYGTDVRSNENDFEIDDDVIYLNFGFYTDEDYYRVYKPDEIRKFINALNRLLDDKYITRFTVY